MADLPRPTVLLDIVEEHFEELDILWAQRESVVFAPDWYLSNLAIHEERCDAHLAGLRLSGGHAVDVAEPALAGTDPHTVTAAAMTLLDFAEAELDELVIKAFTEGADEVREGIRLALRHGKIARLTSALARLAAEGEPPVRVAAMDVIGFHRMQPPQNLEAFMSTLDEDLRAAMVPVLGRFDGPWTRNMLDHAFESQDPSRHRQALETSVRTRVPGLDAACRVLATRTDNPSPTAMEFLGVLGSPDDLTLLERGLGMESLAQGAARGLGALGDPRGVPLLIEAMKEHSLAPFALAAFLRITAATGVEADAGTPPPADVDEDEADLHEALALPDPEKVETWWRANKGKFKSMKSWQDGAALPDTWGRAVNQFPLETRRDFYLRLRAGGEGRLPDVELEQRAGKQAAAFTD